MFSLYSEICAWSRELGKVGDWMWDWAPCSWAGGVCEITDQDWAVACVKI